MISGFQVEVLFGFSYATKPCGTTFLKKQQKFCPLLFAFIFYVHNIFDR